VRLDEPEGFDETFDLSAHAADVPIQQIREYVDNTVAQLERLPELLAAQSEDERIRLELTLTVDADADLMERAVDALRRALGQET
jgi:hypothetical protein